MSPNVVPSMDMPVKQYLSGMQHCLQDCRICPRLHDSECEFLITLRSLMASARMCIETRTLYADSPI